MSTYVTQLSQDHGKVNVVDHAKHHFQEDLRCEFCGNYWEEHQINPTECTRWIKKLSHLRSCNLLRSYKRLWDRNPTWEYRIICAKILGMQKNQDINQFTLSHYMRQIHHEIAPRLKRFRQMPTQRKKLIERGDPVAMSEFVPGTEIPKPEVALTGNDGNAFQIMGNVIRALKKAKVPADIVNQYTTQATSGDYNHLLKTTAQWVVVT